MTTIAIIGGGIAARSLLYTLAKKKYSGKILVFYSDDFAFPCSLHSTAIVAPRGVSTGHSSLGDDLFEGFNCFSQHVESEKPSGVVKILQYTGALTKLDAFKKRYPDGEMKSVLGSKEHYFATEEAYLIRPRDYMDWLLSQAKKNLNIEMVSSYVTEVIEDKIRTQDGTEYSANQIIFTAGIQNELWAKFFPEDKKSKSAQGSYLEFQSAELGVNSFSLTLEGDNLIYDAEKKTLLVGSTTRDSALELAPEKELLEIHRNLSERTGIKLPAFEKAFIRVGLREKASKREAYILHHDRYSMMGGFYKNGYRLSLYMSGKLLSSSAHSY